MPAPSSGDVPLEPLAESLKVLASPTRLELLRVLRTPKALHEIAVRPSLVRGTENPDRPLARQTVTHHLSVLQEAGLVYRKDDGAPPGDGYVLNHERVFALVDELRALAKLTPAAWAYGRAFATMDSSESGDPLLPKPPRLLLAYGRDDGVAFSLARAEEAAQVVVGRGAGSHVKLDYDPYVSTRHCAFEVRESGFVLKDLESRNGTFLNWRRLDAGGEKVLASGDLVTVGRSVLVFQS